MSEPSVFIHRHALCESETVGAGTRLWAFSHVMAGAQVGDNCNLGEHVFVENGVRIGTGCTVKNGVALWEGVTLEDGVFVGPYVVFTNDKQPRAFIRTQNTFFLPTRVMQGASLGANSTIVCGVTIGRYAMIGAGTVVHRNVEDHALVVGNPGREIGRVCYCGQKLDPRDYCASCEQFLSENSMDLAAASRVERAQAQRRTQSTG